jgi:chromosome segregation ATPase
MIDVPTILAGSLLVVTILVALKYYQVLRGAREEYESARETVDDIVLSFNRQLQQETQRLEASAYKIEGLSSKVEGISRSIGQMHESLQTNELKLASALQEKNEVSIKLDEMGKQVQGVVTAQSSFETRISNLDDQLRQALVMPEPNVQAVMPIKRDRALAPLTDTELSVLEMLASEGPKTAPEIKERVKLSREHTARLMKKLYEGGYLERDTGKIPFKYSVKKEMRDILKRTEGESA